MSLSDRFRRWRRGHRRDRAVRASADGSLREFVYLDEVSVFSLVSSRVGSIAAELTASESSSLTGELSSGAGVSAGLFKAEIGSRSEATQLRGTQVLRKATIQATFKELYESVYDECQLRPGGDVPDVSRAPDLATALEAARMSGCATRVDDLKRGGLIEVEVELEAEDLYRVWAVVSAFLELFRETPGLVGADVTSQLQDALSMNALLDRLLGGLVPVRGRAVGVVTVRDGDQEWVVQRRVLDQLSEDALPDQTPLDVVAVAEASLFWKDIRRVLFSGSRYSLLCRIGRDGLQSDWTPVKLVDVVRGLFPEVADQLGSAGRDLVDAMTRAKAAGPTDAGPRVRTALDAYGRLLAEAYGREWDSALITDDVMHLAPAGGWARAEDQRPVFAALTSRLSEAWRIDPGREEVARLRYEALRKAGLIQVPIADDRSSAAPRPPGPRAGSQPRILDTEVIAIYW